MSGGFRFKATCTKCGAVNQLRKLPDRPDVPLSLYLGHDNMHLLKVLPVPPGREGEEWAQPYSVRSFLHQATRHFNDCVYNCEIPDRVFGEPVFSDMCRHEDEWDDSHECDVLKGWSRGKGPCATWTKVLALCQTPTEQRFLHDYIRYVKDRQFPMLLPQVRIGIAERRRPDFVVFLPMQFWRYQKIAVQLDGAHPGESVASDRARDEYIAEHGYETISLKPKERGYQEEVKRLVERVDIAMKMVESDEWEVAVSAEVRSSEPQPNDDIPF